MIVLGFVSIHWPSAGFRGGQGPHHNGQSYLDSKKSKFIVWLKLFCRTVFSRYFIKTATNNIDMLLQVYFEF